MKKKTDIVIPFISGPEDSMELKYALRSIEKNFKSKIPVVVHLIGDKPDWCKNVIHTYSERISGMDYMSFFDVNLKLKRICQSKDIGSGFIYMYDDTMFLQETDIRDVQELKSLEDMAKIKNFFKTTSASRKWCDVMQNSLDALKKEKLPIYNYETHCPRYFNAKKLLSIINKHSTTINPFNISTLYFNTFYKDKSPIVLGKWGGDFRLGLYGAFPFPVLKSKIKTKKILNFGRGRINDSEIIKFLNFLFPDKSKYEK